MTIETFKVLAQVTISQPSVILRRARRDDASFIEALSAEVFGEYAHAAGRRTGRMSEAPEAVTVVALWRARRAGFAVLRRSGSTAHLDAIAVSVVARGRGVGALLLARVEEEARGSGCRRVQLVTADANVAALSLFLRSGYTVQQKLGRYYPRGQDALAMAKTLQEGA